MILSEYFDIYKEFQHRLVVCNQMNDEATRGIIFYDYLISEEKLHYVKPKPPKKVDIINQKLRETLPILNVKNNRNNSKTGTSRSATSFIQRKKYIDSQMAKVRSIERSSFSNKDPKKKPLLPPIKVKQLNTTSPTKLGQLIGKKQAHVFKSYAKILQRFNTCEPERLFQLFEERKKENQQLQRRLDLAKRDCRKLSNKIASKNIEMLNTNQRKETYIAKIKELTINCGLAPEQKVFLNLIKVESFCRDLIKEKRLKKFADKTTVKPKVSFGKVVPVKRVNKRVNNKAPSGDPVLDDIPTIILTPELKGDYLPGTRNTRRTFEMVNECETRSSEMNSIDMDLFGKQLGKALCLCFASKFSVYPSLRVNEDLFEIIRPSHIFLSEKEMENPKIILAELISNYRSNTTNLHISIFSIDEIHRIMPDFLQFISVRDQLMQQFEKYFDEKLFTDMFTQLLTDDINAACYLARDFTMKTRIKDSSAMLLGKMLPFFAQIDQPRKAIPFFAAFGSFLNISNNASLKNPIVTMFTDETSNYIDELIQRPMKPFVRSALTTLLSIAKFHPIPFLMHSTLRTSTLSTVQMFINENIEYTTCVKTGVEFFASTMSEVEPESILCHFEFFQQLLVVEFLKQEMRVDVISSLIEVLISIIANRDNSIVEQLETLHFIQFLMKNIGLEELVGEKSVPKISKNLKFNYSVVNKLLPTLNLDNPKLQLAFPPTREIPFVKPQSISPKEYSDLRDEYPIYYDDRIHVLFIQLLFVTIIDHSLHSFDNIFVDPFPHVNRKPNILFTIMKHMEREENQEVCQMLNEAFTPLPPEDEETDGNVEMQASIKKNKSISPQIPKFITKEKEYDGMETSRKWSNEPNEHRSLQLRYQIEQYHDYKRFLRLLVPALFQPELYQNGQHIASGAFGAVMAVTINGTKYAVKTLQKSRNEFDNPKLVEVYSEVSILDLCKGDRRVTQLINYGCTADSYYIVMEYYPMTLKSWRKSVADNPPLPTILRLFREFLKATTVLTDYRINHFDIKCDNVMLDSEGYPALADFGESMCYKSEQNSYTLLNKGTEWIKSPEMLSIAINSRIENPNFDRRKKFGAGPASDVWSIGCLFFEIVTGEFLFIDTDWSRFFNRVTNPKDALITQKCMKMLPKDVRFSGFIDFVLQRSVYRRPTLQQVINKFDEYFPDAMKGPLPDMKTKQKQEEEESSHEDGEEDEDEDMDDDIGEEEEEYNNQESEN